MVKLKIYTLEQTQSLPITIEAAWKFFSNPNNLSVLTPEWMHMDLGENVPTEMYEGIIMTQQVKPLLGIPLTWVTEITKIKEYEYFIDEQRIGPYRFWHHEHRLRENNHGVDVIDTLHYAMPFSIFGQIAHQLSVKHKIQQVFSYRVEKLESLFAKSH